MRKLLLAVGLVAAVSVSSIAFAQDWNWKSLPDPRGEFVRLCAPHLVGRKAHPESVCGCLHDAALARVTDADLRQALMRGVAETGVPTIEKAWVPKAKLPQLSAMFDAIAQPTLQCMFSQSGASGLAP